MILITGSSGFVGSYLADSGIKSRLVVRDKSSCLKETFYINSLSGETCWEGAFKGVSTVIHLAGLAHSNVFSESEYQEVNVDGTLHLANEAFKAGVKRFVFVSSIGVNGSQTYGKPFSLHSQPKPHNAYANSKYQAEVGLNRIAHETGLEVVIVRPTLVYGPNAPGNFGALVNFISKFPVLPFGFLNNRRDFISVQNLVDLLLTCAKHPKAPGHTFLACEGDTVSTKAFTNSIAAGLNKSIVQIPIPKSFFYLIGKVLGRSNTAEQLTGNLEVDSSKLQEVLNWNAPFTMKQAMSKLLENDK